METIGELLHMLRDVEGIIRWGGLAIICAIVFAETGLLIGFFLPGDSLLFTAGFLAAGGHLNIVLLLVLVTAAAIIGDQVGYLIGYKTGSRIFQREDSRFFKREHLLRTQAFYEKHGGKTIILARFVPIVRTFAPVVAGVASMEYRRFVTYNVVGGFGWVWSMALLGYGLGNIIPREWLEPAVIVIVILSIMPLVVEWWRHRKEKNGAVEKDAA
jgi:membrane-associated protein